MLNKYLKETTFRKLVLPIWPANWWIPDFSENQNLTLNQANLVGGLEHFLFFHILGIITPTDELIFFRGVGIPYTTNQCQKHTKHILNTSYNKPMIFLTAFFSIPARAAHLRFSTSWNDSWWISSLERKNSSCLGVLLNRFNVNYCN